MKFIPTIDINARGVQTSLHTGQLVLQRGQNRLPPTADRWALRSLTYDGVAQAMADQWG